MNERECHVVPVYDLIEHELSEDCACGPSSHLVRTSVGDRWIAVHNSLDGRELTEVS